MAVSYHDTRISHYSQYSILAFPNFFVLFCFGASKPPSYFIPGGQPLVSKGPSRVCVCVPVHALEFHRAVGSALPHLADCHTCMCRIFATLSFSFLSKRDKQQQKDVDEYCPDIRTNKIPFNGMTLEPPVEALVRSAL